MHWWERSRREITAHRHKHVCSSRCRRPFMQFGDLVCITLCRREDRGIGLCWIVTPRSQKVVTSRTDPISYGVVIFGYNSWPPRNAVATEPHLRCAPSSFLRQACTKPSASRDRVAQNCARLGTLIWRTALVVCNSPQSSLCSRAPTSIGCTVLRYPCRFRLAPHIGRARPGRYLYTQSTIRASLWLQGRHVL